MRSPRLVPAKLISFLNILLLLTAAANAESIGGSVTNATTGKPAAGAAVALVDPTGGMAEIGSAKSDAQGRFKIDAPAGQGPRLVRAERGGVNYFKMLPPGSTNVDLTVYDAAPSVEGISGAADVVRLQSDGSTLQGVELFAIRNASSPPKTLAAPTTFEFVLPDGAQIDGADAQGPNGQPITTTTTPTKQKNHYTFSYPLKPGETRFQVSYHMPYSGKLAVSPSFTRDFDHYVLVMPSTMSFSPKDAKQFQAMKDQPGSNVQVSLRTHAGQDLSYSVSGNGTIQDEQAQASPGDNAPAMGGSGANDSRPGGGLGKPIDAPDGLAKYRWYILGLLLTVLVGGGIWTHERTKQAEAEEAPASPVASALQPTPRPAPLTQNAATVPVTSPANLLLAALKEELFELEIERQQGKITPEEYAKARSALEQTLQRALSRTRSS
ncbi:MAG TPA: hypothetical protein VM578_10045 [Candidatus Saccharimonadales bacterium]|nr:hypothetical protein [Candidatus Saccharimonadales bacterium]